MTRPTRPTRPARAARSRSARRTVGALLALAVVATAHAPSVITVERGDTLWELARAHGTTVGALKSLNDQGADGRIMAGDTLRVSAGGGAAAAKSGAGQAASGRAHVVRAGETLSHLAVRYGTTTAAIRSANRLSGSTIGIGRRLTIPSGGGPGGSGSSGGTAGVPTTNAGKRISETVRSSVARNRAILAERSHPSKAAVRSMVAATARRHGVSPSLAVSVAFHESGFQQRVVSGVNAIGVMQVLPSTGRVLGKQQGRQLDLLDTQDNVTAGVLLLRQLVRSTGSNDGALAGYYQGLGSISRQGLLPQTHSYITSINALRSSRFPNG